MESSVEPVNVKCQVCGDAAFGKNFGVYSCESCKAFFRRNADKDIVFGRCRGDCAVNIETRTYCKRCRLKKCLLVGMRKELLRSKIRYTNGTKSPCGKKRRSSESARCREDRVDIKLEDGGLVSIPHPLPQQNSPPQAAPAPHVPIPAQESATISAQSRKKLEEILFAFAMTFEAMPYIDKSNLPNRAPSAVELVNYIEGPTKCMVKFAKNLDTFRRIPVLDQVTLLKAGIVETIVLFSSRNFNHKDSKWELKDGDDKKILEMDPISMTAESSKNEYKNSMGKAVQFMSKLLKRIGSDRTIIKMLGVLSLFSPDRSGVSREGRGMIEAIQEDYALVLQDYLAMRYPEQKTYFAQMLMMLADIREVGDSTGLMLANMDVSKLTPFVVELFELD